MPLPLIVGGGLLVGGLGLQAAGSSSSGAMPGRAYFVPIAADEIELHDDHDLARQLLTDLQDGAA